jgi:sortase A
MSRRPILLLAVVAVAFSGAACGNRTEPTVAAVRPSVPAVVTTATTLAAPASAAPVAVLPGDSLDPPAHRSAVPARLPGQPVVTGRIEIPKIGLDQPTFEGNTLAQIDHGPSHWPGTPMPGHPGNTVFPGHRITHTHPFFFIDQLVPGDQIIFTTAEGRFVYEMYESHIVRPSETWVVDPAPGAIATIFGCHPRGSARYRYVVRARLVSPMAPGASSSPPPTQAPRPTRQQPQAPPPSTAPRNTTTTTTTRPACLVCLH